MAVFLDLPPEILESVFHSLGSIDDVHYFGRACRKTYDIVRRQDIYINIMRSVISQSPQHRYDLQLSRMLIMHEDVVERMQQNGSQLSATQPNPLGYTLNRWESELATASTPTTCNNRCCTDCFPDETIHDILARYQGLRVFEDVWLKRRLTASDYFAADESSEIDDMVRSYQILVQRNELFRNGEILSRSSKMPETAVYNAFSYDQRARFYSAIVYVWLLNEIRWILTNFAYPTRLDVQITLLENAKWYIKGQRQVPLLEELDQYAVFKFMYHHLLPLYGTCLADRDSSKLPFTFASDFTKDVGHCARLLQLFIYVGQTYFQPPDIIDLISRGQAARTHPYPIVTLPWTTEKWQHPSQVFAFPRNILLCDERYKRTILRASLSHLNVIARSSFHQSRHSFSPPVNAPPNEQMYNLQDYANCYFLDRALMEFELHENKEQKNGQKLRNIREVFLRKWDDTLWTVWWWANSEDKARAKMERWRLAPASTKDLTRIT